MELQVNRWKKEYINCIPKDTIGTFLINDKQLSNSLELPIPEDGNYTHGFCIHPGRYKCKIVLSPHLGYHVLQLIDVPGRLYIEIHIGNFDKDTDGCILTGDYVGQADWITHSADEFNVLMDIVNRAINRNEEIWITITENFAN